MGRIHIGRKEKDAPIKTKEASIVYIDQPVEIEKIAYKQDPKLKQRIEELEYFLIQKDLDHKKTIDLITEEMNTTNNSLLNLRNKFGIIKQQREKLFTKLREEKTNKRKQVKKQLIAIGVLTLVTVLLLIK